MPEEPEEDQELLTRLMFRDLVDAKLDVRMPCAHCEGRGSKHGDVCPICDGDKTVTQSMSLYNLAKKLLPFFVHEIRAAADQKKVAEQTAY